MEKRRRMRRILRFVFGGLGLALFIWSAIPVAFGALGIGACCGMLFGLAVCAAAIWYERLRVLWTQGKHKVRNRRIRNAAAAVVCLGIGWAGFLTLCMAQGATAAPPKTATVVVLGCEVRGEEPSADLAERIRTAAEYLKAHPQAAAIASGGQGRGEQISEAEAIRRGLLSYGIEEARIFKEDRSTNTKENIRYSMEVIRAHGLSEEIAIVTDDYHEYRAGQIAARQGVTAFAVPAKTPWYVFSTCYLRELLALTKFFLLP